MGTGKRLTAALLTLVLAVVALSGCVAEEEQEETIPPTKETVVYDSYYDFYHYGTQSYMDSDLATYQAVTGGRCQLSTLSWDFLNGDYSYVVEGYDERYGFFIYEYDSGMLGRYQEYLISQGYECRATQQYAEGISYYFRNESNKYIVELFILQDNGYLVVSPYIEAED